MGPFETLAEGGGKDVGHRDIGIEAIDEGMPIEAGAGVRQAKFDDIADAQIRAAGRDEGVLVVEAGNRHGIESADTASLAIERQWAWQSLIHGDVTQAHAADRQAGFGARQHLGPDAKNGLESLGGANNFT